MMQVLGVYIVAYLLGSIPFGLLFVKWSGRGDLRDVGSGNIGTTNVLRTGSKILAAATLLADLGKGALCVVIAKFLGIDPYGVAFVSVIGHVFPVWLRFKGGKGVATALGCLLVLNPIVGLLVTLTWLFVAKFFRISSLAALAAFALSPFYAWGIGSACDVYFALAIVFLISWTHRGNIVRIIEGNESLIGKDGSEGGI